LPHGIGGAALALAHPRGAARVRFAASLLGDVVRVGTLQRLGARFQAAQIRVGWRRVTPGSEVTARAWALAGCFGGGAEVQQNLTTVSQGQQLTDLKRALDEGAITQDEYNRLQRKILSLRY